MEEAVSRSKLIAPLRNLEGTIDRDSASIWKKSIQRVKLVSIQAPAGFGKTTTVLQILKESPESIRWLGVAPPHTTRESFWRYMAEVFAEDVADSLEPVTAQFSTAATRAEGAVIALCNALGSISYSLDLVIDDYHLLQGTADDELELFLDNTPVNIRTWIISRGHRSLNLARFALRGELYELDPQDLRFETTEATVLLRSVNPKLSDEDCRQLGRQIGGWAAGLRTIGVLLADLPDPELLLANLLKRKNKIVSYLAQDILENLPSDIRDLVTRTIFLERFTSAMAARVIPEMSEKQCKRELRLLEEHGFFLNSSGDDMFSYVPFFKDLVRQYLINRNEDYLKILAVCIEIKIEAGEIEEAATTAEEHGLNEQLAYILSTHYMTWLGSGRYKALLDLLEQLSNSLREAHPPLAGLQIWTRTLVLQDIDHADYLCESFSHAEDKGLCAAAKAYSAFYILGDSKELDKSLREAKQHLNEDFPSIRNILSLLEISAGYLAGDAEESYTQLRRIDRDALYDRNPYVGVLLDLNLVFAQTALMMIDESLSIYTDTRRRLRNIFGSGELPFWDLGWAHDILLRSWNRSDPGLKHEARKAMLRTEDQRSNEIIFLLHRFIAETVAPLSIEDAYYHIDRALYFGGKSGWGRKVALAEASKLACWLDTPEEVRRWLVQMETVEHRGDLGAYILDGARCWASWSDGDSEGARIRTNALLERADVPPLQKFELEILSCRIDDDMAGLQTLVEKAEEKKLGEWARIRSGLPKTAAGTKGPAPHAHSHPSPQRVLTDDEIRGLLDSAGKATINGFEEHFNGRELQILHLMFRGASNEEIADTIYISINTVRWYARQLFAKLDVRRRGEAASAARELGLLETA